MRALTAFLDRRGRNNMLPFTLGSAPETRYLPSRYLQLVPKRGRFFGILLHHTDAVFTSKTNRRRVE